MCFCNVGIQRNLHKPCITSTTWNFLVQFFSVEEEEDEGSDLATKIFPTASLHKYSREKAFKLQTEALALDHFPCICLLYNGDDSFPGPQTISQRVWFCNVIQVTARFSLKKKQLGCDIMPILFQIFCIIILCTYWSLKHKGRLAKVTTLHHMD